MRTQKRHEEQNAFRRAGVEAPWMSSESILLDGWKAQLSKQQRILPLKKGSLIPCHNARRLGANYFLRHQVF